MNATAGRPDPASGPAPQWILVLLAALSSLVVLTTDLYLPVLPQLAADLHTSDSAAAGTLSAALVGIAAAQVVIGPISDAVGRRRPILAGLIGYAVLHALCALAPDIATLLVLRLLSGVATAAVIVVARAVVPDVYPGARSARAFATLAGVLALAPVVAPVAGGALARVTTWRGMFALLAILDVVLLGVAWFALPETLPADRRRSTRAGTVLADLAAVVRRRRFLGYVVSLAGVGAMLFGYIGASPFVLQHRFGLSPQGYSYVFAVNSVGLVAASWSSRSLVVRAGPARLLRAGQFGALAAGLVLAAGVAGHAVVVVAAGLFVLVSSLGFVMPNATSLGMHEAPGHAGAASGVMGIVQFTAGALASPLAGIGGSPWALVAVVLAAATLGLVGSRLLLQAGRADAADAVRAPGSAG